VVDTAIGYRFIPWLRAEALLSWRPSMDFNGQSNFIGAGAPQPVWGSVSSLAGFGVAYVDLPPIGPVQPFLGAGLGAAHNRMGAMRYSFPALSPNASTTTPDGSRTNLAYLLTAGLSVPLGIGSTSTSPTASLILVRCRPVRERPLWCEPAAPARSTSAAPGLTL